MIHGERYGRCIPLLEGVQVDVVQLERSLLLEDSTVRRQLLQIRVLVHDQLPLGHTQATLSCADDGVSSVLVVQPAADAIEETAESCLLGLCSMTEESSLYNAVTSRQKRSSPLLSETSSK